MQPRPEEKRNFFSKRGIFYLLIPIVVLTLVILTFLYPHRFDHFWKRQEPKNEVEEQPLPAVRTMIARPESHSTELSLPSFLVADHVTPILARTNGYLNKFYVDIGDRVKKGQLLCEIDIPDVDAQIPPAQANLKSLQAKEEIAKVTAERWARLYHQDPDAIPKEEVDQTIAAYHSAMADVESAKRTIDYLTVLQSFKKVYAPFDGVVVERNIDVGSLISSGNETLTQPYVTGFEVLNEPLFKISSTEVLRAFVEVPQPYYPFIKDGLKAQVHVSEYPHEIFPGIIDRNANALDQVARTLLTQVNIENKGNLLRPGLFADVKFFFPPNKNNFTIPIGALIIRDGPPMVALLKENDTVFLQQVHIGRDFGNSVQIIKGIKEGDCLIVNPNFKIKEGTKVKVIEKGT